MSIFGGRKIFFYFLMEIVPVTEICNIGLLNKIKNNILWNRVTKGLDVLRNVTIIDCSLAKVNRNYKCADPEVRLGTIKREI